MKYGISQRNRQFVVHLEDGENLMDALKTLCAREKIRAGSFYGTGIAQNVRIVSIDDSIQPDTDQESTARIAAMTGYIGHCEDALVIHAYGTAEFLNNDSNLLQNGRILSAVVSCFDIFITSYDDLGISCAQIGKGPAVQPNRISSTPASFSVETAKLLADFEDNRADEQREQQHSLKAPSVSAFDDSPQFIPQTNAPPRILNAAEAFASAKAQNADTSSGNADEDALSAWRRVAEQAARESARPEPPKTINSRKKEEVSARAQLNRSMAEHHSDANSGVRVISGNSKNKPYNPMQASPADNRPKVALGDMLLHPSLGDCVVVRVEDNESVFIRAIQNGYQSSRFKRITLKLFDLTPVDTMNGRTVYRLTKKVY